MTDNGYKISDPRIKAPAAQPAEHDQDGQTTVLGASYKRGITAIRQTQERINAGAKISFAKQGLMSGY